MRTPPLALDWLPVHSGFEAALAAAKSAVAQADPSPWETLRALAGHRLDFLQTDRLARLLAAARAPEGTPTLRLALAGSMTLDHLVPSLRVGALRRGLALDVFIPPYGQWRQHLIDPASALLAYRPDAVLICAEEGEFLPALPIDAPRAQVDDAVAAKVAETVAQWRMIRDRAGAAVIQQLPLPAAPALFGHYERLVSAAPGAVRLAVTGALLRAAQDEGVLILDPAAAARDAGLDALHDRRLWLHAKQHVSPAAAPWFGDQVGRIVAALRGLSRKVLVLDLDNTLWGGVLGDDGIDGIVIGEGSARGEAFKAFQTYAKALRSRGILLAVSSKNDPQRAAAAFDHPEMILRRPDFACFVADWNDKASGLQRIAQELNLGLDALVFFDDNPAERALIRENLPAVAVPEVPEAAEDYIRCLGSAGYFEAVSYTADDAGRARQYDENAQRQQLAVVAPDMDSFLQGLEMEMQIGPVARVDLARVTQLINKTNQFNLTTRRHTQAEVEAMLADPEVLAFCVRLKDRFGDNGIISVVIGRLRPDATGGRSFDITDWVMSCRVLGRRVEAAVLASVAAEARRAGAQHALGRYRPTAKNEIVADLFARLGFAPATGDDTRSESGPEPGETRWTLDLTALPPPPAQIAVVALPHPVETLT
jgi:FkbH-like protein